MQGYCNIGIYKESKIQGYTRLLDYTDIQGSYTIGIYKATLLLGLT